MSNQPWFRLPIERRCQDCGERVSRGAEFCAACYRQRIACWDYDGSGAPIHITFPESPKATGTGGQGHIAPVAVSLLPDTDFAGDPWETLGTVALRLRDPEQAARAAGDWGPLILERLLAGKRLGQIARGLGISLEAVKRHVARLRRQHGCRNVKGLREWLSEPAAPTPAEAGRP